MHDQCRDYVKRYSKPKTSTAKIVEIGSRDINGTIRDLFPQENYVGLDLSPGPGVDVVIDALDWGPPEPVDMVICVEALEHCRLWRDVVLHACSWLKPNGRIVITCAGPGRAPHSAVDGCQLREGEWYANISTYDLALVFKEAGIFVDSLEYMENHGDTRASGTRI